MAVKTISLPPDFTCPAPSALDLIKQAVANNLSAFHFPDPDVRVSCEGTPGMITILIWPTTVRPNSCDDLARKRATLPDYMNRNGAFGIYVNAGLLRNLAQQAFDKAPKRLDGSSAPTSDGPIHLTGLSVDFVEPDVQRTENRAIKTYIDGYDERPWPDVGFTVTLTDVLDNVPVLHADSASSVDASGVDELLAGLLFPITVGLAVFPPLSFLLLNDIEAAMIQPSGPSMGGVGAGTISLIPSEIPLPQSGGVVVSPPTTLERELRGSPIQVSRNKLVIEYGTPIVNASGLYVSGAPKLMDRRPHAKISGPTSLVIASDGSQTFGNFSVEPADFYGAVSFAWSCSGGDVSIATPHARSTAIYFKRGNAARGSSLQTTVHVLVADNDGSAASASMVVMVAISDRGDELPPICKIKPWLPQCQ